MTPECERCSRKVGRGRRRCQKCTRGERPTHAGRAARLDRTREDTVLACPRCDGTRVRERLPPEHPRAVTSARQGDHRAPYYCDDCQTPVTVPHRRPPRADRSVHGLAKALVEADPDAVTGGEEVSDSAE